VRQAAEASFARHVTFVLDYDPSLPPLSGVPARLIQMLMNIIKNAAEACADMAGAQITISTRYGSFEARKRLAGKALPIHVTIADNGPGIAEQLRAQLFTPFVSSKPGGKGLGLSLAAAIMAQHGGLLEWENAEHGGANFHFYFAAA
jgi:two-component system nitrogen regulation sensor histidine kinase GlnL